MTKHIFVTGGVVSSLGKGLTASSLGRLLKSRGLKVTMQKLDPYLNVDPGTMNPFEHGEVYVTDDGAETDLDLGHYERFTSATMSRSSNVTTGRIYAHDHDSMKVFSPRGRLELTLKRIRGSDVYQIAALPIGDRFLLWTDGNIAIWDLQPDRMSQLLQPGQ